MIKMKDDLIHIFLELKQRERVGREEKSKDATLNKKIYNDLFYNNNDYTSSNCNVPT